MAKPGRKLDRKQVNRRQKYELDYRVSRYRMTAKLGVILLDMLCARTNINMATVLHRARMELRRANREARGKR